MEIYKDRDGQEIYIGDRVVVLEAQDGKHCIIDKEGTILGFRELWGEMSAEIEFDEDIGGHTLNHQCKSGYGWQVYPYKIKRVDEPEPQTSDAMDFHELFAERG